MNDTGALTWVGVDLHVHTPASKDYQGPRVEEEYLALISRANEFAEGKAGIRGKKNKRNTLGCVAFTDHNSVEGFKRYRQLNQTTAELRDSIRLRDPNNSLISKLDNDLQVLNSVRVLMGCEIKAHPGVHLLIIFHESTEPDDVVAFLEKAYDRKYDDFSGDPAPTTVLTLQQVLDDVSARFGDKSMVVAPHIDSGGGLYEALKDFQQLRIAAFKHPVIRALSFNKPETRDKINQLLMQSDYKRSDPIVLIQSSDYHAQGGSALGQPRSELQVPGGKATFLNIREALKVASRVKCSCDFTQEEYENFIRGKVLVTFTSDVGQLNFKESDYEKLAISVGAMLNSEGGILELQGTPPPNENQEVYLNKVLKQVESVLKQRVDPGSLAMQYRGLLFSPSKVRLLAHIKRGERLYTVSENVYVIKNGSPQKATAVEIETIVSRNINYRFGERFENTLESVSTESLLLAKVPRGIPLVLKIQKHLSYRAQRAFAPELVEPPAMSIEGSEQIQDLYEKAMDDAPLGLPCPDGNLNIPPYESALEPRLSEHYLRFTVQRTQVAAEILEKLKIQRVEKAKIAVFLGGGVSIIEPGYLTVRIPTLLLDVPSGFEETMYGFAAWLKSSFMVWYCAVHLGDPDLFLHLQMPKARIPIPSGDKSALLKRLDSLTRNVVLDENKLMREFKKRRDRGDKNHEIEHKEIGQHNTRANSVCLTMDKEIYAFLALADEDAKFIAETLTAIHLNDFGFLELAAKNEKLSDKTP